MPGPDEYAMLDTVPAILRATGLDAKAVRRVVGTLFHFVRGSAQTVAEARQAAAATGASDEDRWLARSALLMEVAPGFTERFPSIAWLEGEGAPETDGVPHLEREARLTFEAGLAVLLDGIEAAIPDGGY